MRTSMSLEDDLAAAIELREAIYRMVTARLEHRAVRRSPTST